MIKVATVFSGIGAAEQALLQMNVEHEIIFACDNGERYLDYTVEEINDIIKSNPQHSKQEILHEIYEETGKQNNVKKSYFVNYNIKEEQWFEDIRF